MNCTCGLHTVDPKASAETHADHCKFREPFVGFRTFEEAYEKLEQLGSVIITDYSELPQVDTRVPEPADPWRWPPPTSNDDQLLDALVDANAPDAAYATRVEAERWLKARTLSPGDSVRCTKEDRFVIEGMVGEVRDIREGEVIVRWPGRGMVLNDGRYLYHQVPLENIVKLGT